MKLAWLPLALILVPVINMAITYPLAYSNGHTNGKIITFISSTINFPPEASIGAIGFAFTSFLFIIFSHFRYNFINGAIETAEMALGFNMNNKLNPSVCLAWIAAFGLTGLAVFRYHDTPDMHLGMTLVFFLPAVVYMYFQAFFDLSLKLSSHRLRVFRVTCAVGSSLFTMSMIALLQFADYPWGFTLCALSEILTVLLFLAVIASYAFDFSKIDWHFDVRHNGEYYADGAEVQPSPSSPLITRKA